MTHDKITNASSNNTKKKKKKKLTAIALLTGGNFRWRISAAVGLKSGSLWSKSRINSLNEAE